VLDEVLDGIGKYAEGRAELDARRAVEEEQRLKRAEMHRTKAHRELIDAARVAAARQLLSDWRDARDARLIVERLESLL